MIDRCTTLKAGTLLVIWSCGEGVWTKLSDETDSCLYVPSPSAGSIGLFLAEEMKTTEGNRTLPLIPHLKLLVNEKIIYVPYKVIQYSILADTHHT